MIQTYSSVIYFNIHAMVLKNEQKEKEKENFILIRQI